jgi:hypothetical protein
MRNCNEEIIQNLDTERDFNLKNALNDVWHQWKQKGRNARPNLVVVWINNAAQQHRASKNPKQHPDNPQSCI